MEPDQEPDQEPKKEEEVNDGRAARRNKREVPKAKALKYDEEKKAKKKKAAADKAGPSGYTRNVQAEKEEEALVQMMKITGRSEEECAQALIIQTEPGKEFTKVYHSALHMLMGDDDPNKEGWANLAKDFQG